MRPDKIINYLQIANTVALRSPCSRRKFGAILVKDNVIISTGYNGSVRRAWNCGEDIICLKDLYQEKPYQSYDHCPAVHAEVNVILNAAREGKSTVGSTLYLGYVNDSDKIKSDRPCRGCRRVVIQTGIKDVFYIDKDGELQHEMVSDWVKMEDDWLKKELESYETENHV